MALTTEDAMGEGPQQSSLGFGGDSECLYGKGLVPPDSGSIVISFPTTEMTQLGLGTELEAEFDCRQFASHHQRHNLDLPSQVFYEEPNAATPTTQSCLADQFSIFNSSPMPEVDLSSVFLGQYPSQSLSWQATSLCSQMVFPQEPLPQARNELPRQRSRYRTVHRNTPTQAIQILRPTVPTDTALDPMQRWQDSPPEVEAASLSAIADALQNVPLRRRTSAGSFNSQRPGSSAASAASFGSGTSASSVSAGSSKYATHRAVSRGRGRKPTRMLATKGRKPLKRGFPCTFCCDSFKGKYDWARHENSLHLNLQGWQCTPFGSTVLSPDTGRIHCAYCNQWDPSPEHLRSHNHQICQNPAQPRVFSRKDHLVQHLMLVHQVQTPSQIDSWQVQGPPVASRCGFCSIRMETWRERTDHLATHFRQGATMDDWKGEHEFEPLVAAQVRHALPPYLIAAEAKAPVPFSATRPGTRDHLSQIHRHAQELGDGPVPIASSGPPPELASHTEAINENTDSMTFPDVLALHLGRFARKQMILGNMPTDKMFQQEARRIIFDSEDPWDQTIADNPDWLARFRNRHLGDIVGDGGALG